MLVDGFQGTFFKSVASKVRFYRSNLVFYAQSNSVVISGQCFFFDIESCDQTKYIPCWCETSVHRKNACYSPINPVTRQTVYYSLPETSRLNIKQKRIQPSHPEAWNSEILLGCESCCQWLHYALHLFCSLTVSGVIWVFNPYYHLCPPKWPSFCVCVGGSKKKLQRK